MTICEQIEILERRRARCARIAWNLEHSGRPNWRDRCDWLDALHDQISDAIGHLENELFDLESAAAMRDASRDRAYGAWVTGA